MGSQRYILAAHLCGLDVLLSELQRSREKGLWLWGQDAALSRVADQVGLGRQAQFAHEVSAVRLHGAWAEG